MIYLNNETIKTNSLTLKKRNNKNNSSTTKQDYFTSFSGEKPAEIKSKKKINLFAYIASGAVLLAGIVILVMKIKKGKENPKLIKNAEETLSAAASRPAQIDDLVKIKEKTVVKSIKSSPDPQIEESIAPLIKSSPDLQIEESIAPLIKSSPDPQIEESIAPLIKSSPDPQIEESIAPLIKSSPDPQIEKSIVPLIKSSPNSQIEQSIAQQIKPSIEPQSATTKTKAAAIIRPSALEEQANKDYDMYVQKLVKEFKLEEKEPLIREVLPDLMIHKHSYDQLKAVLEHVTPQNKEFVINEAVPAISRNTEVLDLEHVIGSTLKAISPETVDCLDKLAMNAEAFNIKSGSNTRLLLKALTKDNKDFAFNDLFPLLLKDKEKYGITRGGLMAKYLEVITPQNKDFILNEALPMFLENSKVTGIPFTTALKISKCLNKEDLKKVQEVARNIEQLGLKDANGFLDVDKFVAQVKK